MSSLSRCCRRSSSSSMITRSKDFWWKLPQDIKVEIFCRLPESDLIAFKRVCKDWNFVISRVCIPCLSPPRPAAPLVGLLTFEDTDAGGSHPNNTHKLSKPYFAPIGEYFYTVFARRYILSQPTLGDDILSLLLPSAGVLDFCNGFLLLAASNGSAQCCYYVGNPVTKQRVAVPVNPNNNNNIHSSLLFEPSLSFNFKIVSYTRPAVDATPTDPMKLDIFSSESRGWSSHVLHLEPHNLYGFEWIWRSIYFNGALYYMSKAQYLVCIDGDILNGDDCFILKAWGIELPDKDDTTTEQNQVQDHHPPLLFGCIGNSAGCFYYSNRDAQGSSILVWMLVGKGKNSQWVLRHRISIDHDIVPNSSSLVVNPERVYSLRPCAFDPIDDDQMFMASSKLLASYNFKTKAVRSCHAPIPGHGNILLEHNVIFPFFRRLLLINKIATPGNVRE